jgi:hypothetical protein
VRRPRLVVLVALSAVFLAVSLFLARWLGTEGAERDAVASVVQAQARGDVAAVLNRLEPACRRDPACVARVRANSQRLARPGDAKVLRIDSDTAYALGSARGISRVVWTVLDSDVTIVQCFDVRRKGNAFAGHSITLRSVSAPIGLEASC